jgi:Tfp pilus assembly protein PilO
LRSLTKSERRLSVVLGLAVFVMLNFYGLSYLLDEHAGLAQKIAELQGQQRSDELWLRERALWLARKEWLDSRQPHVPTGSAAQSELLEALTKAAKDHTLTIEEQSFGETKNTGDYRSVAVKLKLSGRLEDVVKWLVAVQQPERFQAVTNLVLKSTDTPPNVNLELEVARWYAPNV